jgi:DNA-directed RNA polymerases I, II, and III subunit RPABC2
VDPDAPPPEGEEGLGGGEDVAQVNGINGVDHDQEMVTGEPDADATAVGAGLTGERQPNKVRVTTPYLTKYERARILGTRALQIR